MRIKYLDRDFRQERSRMCARTYTYAHTYTPTPAQALAYKNFQTIVVSIVWFVFVSIALAWWVCLNAQFNLGERNCSAGIIVGRNPDDSGQVTVNQRTTTPLFKVIIRDR